MRVYSLSGLTGMTNWSHGTTLQRGATSGNGSSSTATSCKQILTISSPKPTNLKCREKKRSREKWLARHLDCKDRKQELSLCKYSLFKLISMPNLILLSVKSRYPRRSLQTKEVTSFSEKSYAVRVMWLKKMPLRTLNLLTRPKRISSKFDKEYLAKHITCV